MNELIDLADLTWEQKEQVIRQLFARINGSSKSKKINSSDTSTSLIEAVKDNDTNGYNDDDFTDDFDDIDKTNSKNNNQDNSSNTFITQSNANIDGIFNVLPKSNQHNTPTSNVKLPAL
jgi:hypothetical protein